jgi:DNA-binding NarL/FixJ family response regulator
MEQSDGRIKESLNTLKHSLEDLTDPFINKIESQFRKLTPREVQICDMIRNGMTSKEIASILHTSEETVRTQRKMIRRKLNIANNKINLRSYLQTL